MSRSRKQTSRASGRPESDLLRERAWRADQLVDQALTSEDDEKAEALARGALDISPDCVEAYLLLAELSFTPQDAISLLEQAVAAGTRVIGPRGFRELAGQFWLALETRGYMRAREELAECLRELGRIDEAIEHFRGLLELNPNDNQGCRYRLASMLLREGRHTELETLLDQYPQDWSAEWPYIRALLAFQSEGDCEASRRLLRAAQEVNPHVPAYLTQAKSLPREAPEFISPGQESEAVSFVGEFLPVWRSTPGAIPWVRQVLDVREARASRPPRRFSWAAARRMLEHLPQQVDEFWEADLVPQPKGESGGQLWVLLLVAAESGDVIVMEPDENRPADSELLRRIIDAMREPDRGEPHRPGVIQVARRTWARNWGPRLEQIGIRCEVVAELPGIREASERFATAAAQSRHQESQRPPEADQLTALPQAVGEVWLATVRRLPTWIQIEGRMRRPSVALVVDGESGHILSTGLTETDPPSGWLWEQLRLAMSRPAVGEPRRPGVVRLLPDSSDTNLSLDLESLDIQSVELDDAAPFEELLEDLASRLGGAPRIKPLVRAAGISAEQLASFYAAAADYYRAAPWRLIPGDTILRVETEAFMSGPWYAVVMGQSGLELGFALYEDLSLLRKILSGRMSDEEQARRTAALSVTYGEVFDVTPQDADAIEQRGWPIAGPQAYPCVMRVNPGLALRTPLPWELELAEACLRVIPEYLRQSPAGTKRLSAALGSRAIPLTLSRME